MKIHMKSFLLFICFLLLVLPVDVSAQERQSKGLFVVIVGDKRGYINQAGEIIIKPQFQGATNFSEGLAVVAVGNDGYKGGYIDETGKFVIAPKFDNASGFSEGFAAVGLGEFGLHGSGDHKWGFINKTGEMVIEPQYRSTYGFVEGVAAVQDDNGKWGFIDTTGRMVIPSQFTFVTSFSEGLACVMIGRKFGFIDKLGKVVIQPRFTSPGDFSEGLAIVRIGGKTTSPSPYVGTYGSLGGKQVYIDKKGKTVITLKREVESATPFSEGLAVIEVKKRDGYLYNGYINKSGEVIIEPQFGGAENFSEELALVLLNGKWNYIDKTGQIVIRTDYSLAQDFHDGLASVQTGGIGFNDFRNAKFGYIDKSGKTVWTPSN